MACVYEITKDKSIEHLYVVLAEQIKSGQSLTGEICVGILDRINAIGKANRDMSDDMFSRNISYWWRSVDGQLVTSEQRTSLDEDAWDRILPMLQDGYTSGELISEVDDLSFRGWWQFKDATFD